MSRILALIMVVLLAASSLVFVGSVSALSPPKPSVPEFTITTANINTIQINISNQIFSPSDNAQTYHLYYNIRVKGHSSDDWTELYPLKYGASSQDNVYVESPYVSAPIQSSSDKTELSISNANYPSNSQLDIQVQAIIGHDSQVWISDHPTQPQIGGYYKSAVAFDISSDWSNIQTIAIPENIQSTLTPTQQATTATIPTTTPNPTESTPDSQLTWLTLGVAIGLGVVVGLLVVLVGFMRRRIRVLERKQNGT